MSVHATSLVDPDATVAEDVVIGPFTTVGPGVQLGAGAVVDGNCVLGHTEPGRSPEPLVVGPGARIRSHSVLYGGSVIGERLETGHHVTIREGLQAGENLRVGTLSDLQGHAEIGDYVRLHSNVHIGQGSRIGDFVWIFPYTVLTNDPHPPSDGHLQGVTVEDFAVIATRTTLLPGVRVGRDAFIGAGTLVTKDVAEGALVAGTPGKDRGEAGRIRLTGTDEPAYPWRRHFRRGYPDAVTSEWSEEFGELP